MKLQGFFSFCLFCMIILERMRIIDQLRNLDSFTPTEKAIVRYLEENGRNVVNMNLEQLSKELYVSKSSIIRLCKKLGFKGHKELCVELAKEFETFVYEDELINPSNPYHPSDSAEVIAGKTFQLAKGSLTETMSGLDMAEVEGLAYAITKYGKLYIYVSDECAPLGEILADNLCSIGVQAEMRRSPLSMVVLAINQPKDSVALFLTYSLFPQELKKCAEKLRETGIPIYMICGMAKSNTPALTEHVIRIQYYEPFPKVCNVGSRMAVMYILDVIYGIVFYKDYDRHAGVVRDLEISLR